VPEGFYGLGDFTGLPTGGSESLTSVGDVGFLGFLDFTGLPTGVQLQEAVSGVTGGFYGLLDFTGVPTGVQLQETPSGPPFCGFYGLADFTGCPTGLPPEVVPPVPGASTLVGGARVSRPTVWASHVHYQSVLDDLYRTQAQEALLRLTARVVRQHLEHEQALFEHRRTAITAVLLSEV